MVSVESTQSQLTHVLLTLLGKLDTLTLETLHENEGSGITTVGLFLSRAIAPDDGKQAEFT